MSDAATSFPPLPDVEEGKLLIEREKLRVEWWKVWLTPVSILASSMIGAVTIAGSFWSQQRRAEAEFKLEQKRAVLEFELKAAEIVMNSTGPTGTRNKARALAALFPDRISPNFADAFAPEMFQAGLSHETPQKLLELVAQHPDQKSEIIATWKRLFPRDSWVEAFQRPTAPP